jgi:Tol biopolymer transport system component
VGTRVKESKLSKAAAQATLAGMKFPIPQPLGFLLVLAALTSCARSPLQRAQSYIQDRFFVPCNSSYVVISQPTWSSDGTKIAYLSGEPGQLDVFVVDIATGVTNQVTNIPGAEDGPVWSPDGSRLLFSRNGLDIWSSSVLTMVETDGSNITDIANPDTMWVFGPAAWSPDGSHIVVSANLTAGGFGLYAMDIETGALVHLTSKKGILSVWSQDGQQIAFLLPDDTETLFDLAVMNSDGTELRRLTTGHLVRLIRWSPDGTRIAFQLYEEGRSLAVVNVDGTGFAIILEPNESLLDLAWAPDGDHLLYWISDTVGSVRVDGEGQTDLVKGSEWDEGQFSPDGNWIAYVNDNALPFSRPELFISRLNGSQPIQMTHNDSNRLCFDWPF